MLPSLLFQQKRFWAALAAGVLVLVSGGWWAARSYRRAEVRAVLNAHAPFRTPPLELMLPRVLVEDSASRALLEPGVRQGLWVLQPPSVQRSAFEIRLTGQGQRLFSVVGDQIIATFTIGSREVTYLDDLEENFPSRRARFRYVWKALHSRIGLLGAPPEIGREYAGEAWLFYENNRWKVLRWTTPELDEVVARFRGLPSPADRPR